MRCYAVLFAVVLLAVDLAGQAASELRTRVETFSADLADLRRRYDTPMSIERRDRLQRRYTRELKELEALDFDGLGRDGRIDWLLLENHVRRELHGLGIPDTRRRLWAGDTVQLKRPFGSGILPI